MRQERREIPWKKLPHLFMWLGLIRGPEPRAPTRNAMGSKDFAETDLGKPASALVGVVPTHTGLSLQCIGHKLVAFLRSSPSFL